jgi:glycosyltransferase involved in cell wall biosynthesis
MRLTVLGPGHPFRGGIARATTALVAALADRGHEMLFLTPRRQYPSWLYPGASDRDPESCPRLECARPVLDPLAPLTWRRARSEAMSHRGEAWIVPYWTWAWSGLWWSLLRTRGRPRALGLVHNPVDHDAGMVQRAAARAVLGRCTALFTHAAVLARQLEAAYPGKAVAFHRLPAADLSGLPDRAVARSALDLPSDRRVALFLGLIRPYKGVEILLEAAAGLGTDSDWLILVAGEPWGDLGDRLRRQVDSLGLARRVRLDLGWIPEHDVPGYLAAADVLVLPYLRGSQSAVAPMALASGVPVLSTAVGGVPEVVVDGANGVIVPPGDPAALTAALEALDVPRLATLAEGARSAAESLTWSSYAVAVEKTLERMQ